jgi:hypothetical protein
MGDANGDGVGDMGLNGGDGARRCFGLGRSANIERTEEAATEMGRGDRSTRTVGVR